MVKGFDPTPFIDAAAEKEVERATEELVAAIVAFRNAVWESGYQTGRKIAERNASDEFGAAIRKDAEKAWRARSGIERRRNADRATGHRLGRRRAERE